ncbi:MAG: hydroxyacid dehydrogenase [Eubacteriales bacterium]|nr:hydroxyacid dehydrogenase [Eubacteriales bacterium]
MTNETTITKSIAFTGFAPYDTVKLNALLNQELSAFSQKVVVLDDDPTGVQTVHDVFVYTDWSVESLRDGLEDGNSMFFVLTNSRSFTEAETAAAHQTIAKNLVEASKQSGVDFILISRSDSTLRGHYPLETEVLRTTLEQLQKRRYDGEVIMPFFPEGSRFTLGNVHYVADGDQLCPAGETEFAKDRTFGYASSNLCEWVAEKSRGAYPASGVCCITLEELRACDYDGICTKLMQVQQFGKIIVNAIAYEDVKSFTIALLRAMKRGKNYLFRTAAALPKIIGCITDRGLLSRDELVNTANTNGGVIIVGSHVSKTTRQLEMLRKLDCVRFIEFNQHLVADGSAFHAELDRVVSETDNAVASGTTVAVYTRRERFDLNNGNKEDELRMAIKISNAVTSIIARLKVRPNFIIAKGGITSSDVGTKALRVKKALVLGQILKGIPVWLTGPESRFPDMPYVIFPGNVGNDDALYDAVTIMQPERNGLN